MTAGQLTELLLIAGSIVAAILGWKVYQILRAYHGAIECEGEVVSVTSYEASVLRGEDETTTASFIQVVEFKLNGRKYDAPVDDYDSRQTGGMSRALLKLSGSLVHDYATISDDSPSPNRASRARRAATSAGIS